MRFPILRPIWFVALGAIALLVGCATGSFSPRQATLATDRVNLPTTKLGGQLWIEARLNGAGPFLLLVDTGCTSMLLPQRVANAAGLKFFPKWEGTTVNADGVESTHKIAWVENFESGGFRLNGFYAAVKADDEFAALSALDGRPFDGAIGMGTLKDLVLEMDFSAGQVTVARVGAERYPDSRAISYRGIIPQVAISVGGKVIDMDIDTGADGALSVPKLDDISLSNPRTKAIGAGAVFGKTSGKRGERGQLAGEARLGPFTWVNPPLTGMGYESKQGRVGVAAIDTWKLVVDQKNKQLYFLGGETTRTWEKEEPTDARFAAGFFAEIEGTGLRLIEVDDGGAADLAGLRSGDLIVEMDGSPAVQGIWKGERPKLRVQRGGVEFETRLIAAPDYSPRQTILSDDRVELPTTSSRGVLMLEARINGQGPYRLLVSSGSRALQLSQRVVDAAGLKPMADWKASPNQTAATQVVWVDRVESGGLQLKGMAALVASAVAMENGRQLIGPVDGSIGMEALHDLILEVDLPGKKVAAVKPGSTNYPAERAIDFRGTSNIELDIAGTKQRAFLDTGSNRNFELPLPDNLPLLRAKEKLDGIGSSATTKRVERGQLDGEIHAGPVSWVRPFITSQKVPRIGAPTLGIWKLVFDQQAHKIYFLEGKLQRTAVDPAPVAPEFKPGFLAWMDGPGLRLTEVDVGGAFDRAGLRVADLIVSVDGKPVQEWRRTGGAFSRQSQPRFKLQVQREGAEFETTLVLAPTLAE